MALNRIISGKNRAGGLCGTALVLLAIASVTPAHGQAFQDAIDFTKLKSRVPSGLANGAGNVLSMVEAQFPANSGAYWINTASPEFTGAVDPFSQPVQLINGTGTSTTVSNHANGVAYHLFGDLTSIADGANTVWMYEANDWLVNRLRYNSTNDAPEAQPYDVQNHSWVSVNTVPTSQDQSILRRVDWLVETGELTTVVGANNIATTATSPVAQPALLAHSYNSIVVGRTDGFHSRGATNAAYGGGRFRPDVVAPAGITSHATPIVGSVASLLRQAVAGTDGERSETIKAMIMAGATKTEFAGFLDPLAGMAARPWDHTQTRPLDDVFGAGEVNVYNSYVMTVGGRFAGSTTQPTVNVGSYGWDYQDRKSDSAVGDLFYNFEVPAGSTAQELSIILSWNAKITDTNGSPAIFTPSESLQNLDLKFYDSTSGFLGSLVDQSISAVDNVEHIYQTNLGPGTYTLAVSGAASWDYGLAWRMTTAFDQVSADFDEDGDVDGADLLTWQSNLGRLTGALHGDGDADGDGDVDAADLAAVEARAMPTPTLQARGAAQVAAAAIPEPATLALATAALAALGWASRGTRRG